MVLTCSSHLELNPSESRRFRDMSNSMPNLRSLNIEDESNTTLLALLLRMMPNVKALSVDAVADLPDLVPCLVAGKQSFTKLDFGFTILIDAQVIEIVNMNLDSLLELKVNCTELSAKAFESISRFSLGQLRWVIFTLKKSCKTT